MRAKTAKPDSEPAALRRALRAEQARRRKAERELKDTRIRCQAIFDHATEAILLADDDASVVEANPAACRLTGYSRDELLGRSLWDLTPAADRSHGQLLQCQLIESGTLSGDYTLRRKDGTLAEVAFRAMARILPGLHMALYRDITTRKQAQRRLKITEAQLAETHRVAKMGSWEYDARTNRAIWSDESYEILGQPRGKEPLVMQSYLDCVHPDDRARVTEMIHSARRAHEYVCRIVRPDGTERMIQVHSQSVRDKSGKLLRTYGTTKDVTTLKQAEAALEQSERLLQTIVSNAPVILFATDSAGVLTACMGRDAADAAASWGTIVGHSVYDVFGSAPLTAPSGKVGSTHEAISRALGGQTATGVASLANRFYDTRIGPIVEPGGTVTGVIGVASDITELKLAEQELRDSNQRIVDTLEGITDAFLALDREWRVTYLNREAERLLRRKRNQLLGKVIWDEFQEAVGSTFQREYEKAVKRNRATSFVEYYPPLEAWYHVHASPTTDGLLIYFHDVTERKQAEIALRDSEENFRAIFEQAEIGMSLTGIDGKPVRVNSRLCEIMGYSAEEMLQSSFLDITHPDDMEIARRQIARCLARGQRCFSFEKRYIHKSGRVVWANLSCSMIRKSADAPRQMIIIVEDISERRRAEEEMKSLLQQVRAGREQMQVLSQRLLEVQELERRHIARELHDEIGQSLTAIKINLQAAQNAVPPATSQFNDSIAIVEGAIEQVRDLSLHLRPSLLDDLGLVAALRWYIDNQGRRAGLHVSLTIPRLPRRVSPQIETACFRVAQESLTNVIRHAAASSVTVELAQRNGELHLTLCDNGIGFDVESVQKRPAPEAHLGLIGMQERVRLAGGWLALTSGPGNGTTVEACFPISARATERRAPTRSAL